MNLKKLLHTNKAKSSKWERKNSHIAGSPPKKSLANHHPNQTSTAPAAKAAIKKTKNLSKSSKTFKSKTTVSDSKTYSWNKKPKPAFSKNKPQPSSLATLSTAAALKTMQSPKRDLISGTMKINTAQTHWEATKTRISTLKTLMNSTFRLAVKDKTGKAKICPVFQWIYKLKDLSRNMRERKKLLLKSNRTSRKWLSK
jgi:hypothetical protein